jgi:hypothetical protein
MLLKRYTLNITILLVIGTLLSSCSVTKTGTAAEFNTLTDIVENNTIRIEADAAYPNNTYASQQIINQILINRGDTANRIDLQGDGAFIEFDDNNATASLPFYGERRQSSSYNDVNDAGINFDAVPLDYEIERNDERRRYDISYTISDGTENYDVDVVLFANKTAVVFIWSNQRTRIEYRGRVIPAKE